MSAQSERRTHFREKFSVPAVLEFADGFSVDAEVKDLSLGGVMVDIAEPTSLPSDHLNLRFMLVGRSELVALPATVTWKVLTKTGLKLGLTFTQEPSDTLVNYFKDIPGLREERII